MTTLTKEPPLKAKKIKPMTDHLESSVKIYATNDYKLFKKIKGNRALNGAKVEKIMKSIEDGGINVMKYAPIIVNENMQIIDGQHRFEVCKNLKHSVYYVVSHAIKETAIPVINSNSSNWSNRDYLNYYVSQKQAVYIKLNEFVNRYPRISISIAACLFHTGSVIANDIKDTFRSGTLVDRFAGKGESLADKCKTLEAYTDNPYSRRMMRAMGILLNNDKYDHKTMLLKLEQSGKRIDDIESPKRIISQMELIINYHTQKRVYIS